MGEKWKVLVVVCTGIFMSTLDGSILNIAIPTISGDLTVPVKTVQWTVTAYMLTITATLLLFGRLGDRVGSNRVFTCGLLVFTLGSLLCSLSSSFILLVVFRIVQSLGASMMMATGIGIVSAAFPASERGKALGLTGSMVGIGNMAGPGLGGLIVSGYSWPGIFLLNIPIGLAGLFMALRFLPRQAREDKSEPTDQIGLLLLALASFTLVVGSSQVSPVLLLLGVGALVFFILFEKKQSAGLLDLETLTNHRFRSGNLLAFLSYATQPFIIFLMPFFLENVMHFPPWRSGMFMTIPPVVMAITAPLAGTFYDRRGGRMITAVSFALLIAANLILGSVQGPQDVGLIALGLAIFGLGMGSFGSPNSSIILSSIPREKYGYAGGFMATIRNLAFALGTALAAGLFSLQLGQSLTTLTYSPAFLAAIHNCFRVALIIPACGFVFTLYLLKKGQE